MAAQMVTDIATIGARPFIEWDRRGYTASAIDVLPVLDVTTWRVQLAQKISEYRTLPHNWNSYGSPPPTDLAVKNALDFVFRILKDTHIQPRTNPVSGGGVQMDWAKEGGEIEIEFMPNGTVECVVSDNKSEDIIVGLPTTSDMDYLLAWLANT